MFELLFVKWELRLQVTKFYFSHGPRQSQREKNTGNYVVQALIEVVQFSKVCRDELFVMKSKW